MSTNLGVGWVPLDYFTILVLWVAAAVNLYLGIWRVNRAVGIDLLARRMVAIGFLGQALNLTFRMWQFDGDLPVSPIGELLYILVALASGLLGINRVREGRKAVE